MTHPTPPRSLPGAASPASAALPSGVVAEWYAAHGEAVYGYLRFHLPSPDLADDLAAEVFLRAFRASGRYDPARGTVRGWLLRIARNVLLDHCRQARRRPVVPLSNLRDLQSEAPSPEERLLWEEEVARLLAAVAMLPAADRELLGLRYGSGLSAAEAGEILGVSETAVRTRLWRALKRLRAVLES